MKAGYLLPSVVVALLFTGCMVGPKFTPPVVETPESYLYGGGDSTVGIEWQQIFDDTTLVRCIETALANNRNMAMAVSRVEQARITLNATKSNLWPQFNYNVQGQYGKESFVGLPSDKAIQTYILKPTVSWELDLWGKIRRAREADRYKLLSSGMAAQGVRLSLVADVADAYFTYLQYEFALKVAESTVASSKESYLLVQRNYKAGGASQLAVQQAQSQLASVVATVPQYTRAKIEALNSLYLLMGRNPGDSLPPHTGLMQQKIPADIPAGLPSDLLERRPDVMQAYYGVGSANAMIGVAQAMRFPSVALTGTGGLLSENIKDLFKSSSFIWSGSLGITGPILNFGANRRRVQLAREQHHEAVLNYQQSYLQAISDVENNLVALMSLRVEVEAMDVVVQAAQKSYDMATIQYKAGAISYLNLLDAERTLFEAQSNYAGSMAALLSGYTNLYKALGGGWSDRL